MAISRCNRLVAFAGAIRPVGGDAADLLNGGNLVQQRV